MAKFDKENPEYYVITDVNESGSVAYMLIRDAKLFNSVQKYEAGTQKEFQVFNLLSPIPDSVVYCSSLPIRLVVLGYYEYKSIDWD